jgi:hypothetical protein
LIQSGDDDWIKSLFPSGLRSKSFDGYGTYQEPCPERPEVLLFGGISPPNKKASSLCPRRLGGENFILDKHVLTCLFELALPSKYIQELFLDSFS